MMLTAYRKTAVGWSLSLSSSSTSSSYTRLLRTYRQRPVPRAAGRSNFGDDRVAAAAAAAVAVVACRRPLPSLVTGTLCSAGDFIVGSAGAWRSISLPSRILCVTLPPLCTTRAFGAVPIGSDKDDGHDNDDDDDYDAPRRPLGERVVGMRGSSSRKRWRKYSCSAPFRLQSRRCLSSRNYIGGVGIGVVCDGFSIRQLDRIRTNPERWKEEGASAATEAASSSSICAPRSFASGNSDELSFRRGRPSFRIQERLFSTERGGGGGRGGRRDGSKAAEVTDEAPTEDGGESARVRKQRKNAIISEYLSGGKITAAERSVVEDAAAAAVTLAAAAAAAAAVSATVTGPSASATASQRQSQQQLPQPPPPVQDEWRHLHRYHPDVALPSHRELAETYRRIERLQKRGWEKSRAQTSANVRRALQGNLVICAAKFGAWLSSGSSAMLSEFIHSVVDCGNQSLLLLGLRDSALEADRRHPYGYGKSVYFWALVSALGTFFLGAGVSMTNAVGELIEGPSLQEVTWQVWSVLSLSFAVDGYVLWKTVVGLRESMPEGTTLRSHLLKMRDPATLAILLEDGAACLGVLIAIAGIGATSATGMPVFDGLAGVTISALLAAMGLALVRVNHRFLLGQAVDPEITRGIEKILLNRSSIDTVYSVQSQWTGAETFSYKAEVDFDGTFLAAKIMPRYQREFLEARDTLDSDLRVLLSWYAEDVMRTVEREVRDIEAEIREAYPGAEFIELEPMGKDSNRFAIDDGMEAQLKRIEMEALNRFLKSMYKPYASKAPTPSPNVTDQRASGSSRADGGVVSGLDESEATAEKKRS